MSDSDDDSEDERLLQLSLFLNSTTQPISSLDTPKPKFGFKRVFDESNRRWFYVVVAKPQIQFGQVFRWNPTKDSYDIMRYNFEVDDNSNEVVHFIPLYPGVDFLRLEEDKRNDYITRMFLLVRKYNNRIKNG